MYELAEKYNAMVMIDESHWPEWSDAPEEVLPNCTTYAEK